MQGSPLTRDFDIGRLDSVYFVATYSPILCRTFPDYKQLLGIKTVELIQSKPINVSIRHSALWH